jgi:signal transduction histidine kinase
MEQPDEPLPAWVDNPSLASAYLAHLSTLAAEFAAGAGHEINNPLATILGHAQLLLRGETDPDRRKSLEAIGGQALRIRDMIGDAMLFARPPAPVLAACDLGALVREVVSRLSQEAGTRRIQITTTFEPVPPLKTDATQLKVVLGCLVRNAFEAMPEGGDVRLHLSAGPLATNAASAELSAAESSEVAGGDGVRLVVTDTGRGFGADELRWAFNPFFSGRQAGRGLGFGLPKCQAIVHALGGQIEIANGPERGAVATVWLPR